MFIFSLKLKVVIKFDDKNKSSSEFETNSSIEVTK